jgi:ActR/RegA family two-component response regulator
VSTSVKNLLVVEDNQDWCDSYERAASRENFDTVKIAQDLAHAELYIDQMQFGVAFVDIGLNEADDRNIDGIRVLEKIRDAGDPTSIIVVTGRSGRDVLPITRDAIMKYGAFHIVGKADIVPQDIRRLLSTGLAKYREELTVEGLTPENVLRGSVPRLHWEDQMLRTARVRDGVQGLHKFLAQLLGEYLPMLRPHGYEPVKIASDTGLAHGIFWSRAIGRPVAVVLGGNASTDSVQAAEARRAALDQCQVGELLASTSAHGLSGDVFELKNPPRDAFGEHE